MPDDEKAWRELVRRYSRLVAVVIRQYRLSAADTQDVSQLVWLRLLEHVHQIREPAALPGWLTTTTRHECRRYLRVSRRYVPMDPLILTELSTSQSEDPDTALLATERHRVLIDALAELTPRQRRLLALLASEPQTSYAEISKILHMPVGSIGPTRARALTKLRGTDAVRRYLQSQVSAPDGSPRGSAQGGSRQRGYLR